MKHNYQHAFWIGGPTGKPIKIYVHGEYKDKNGVRLLQANKGNDPSIYTFGVKEKDIVWLKGRIK